MTAAAAPGTSAPASAATSRVRLGRARLALAGLAAAALAAGGTAWAIGWWLDCSEPPRKADLIVVLAGHISRPLYASDLYREGLAPEIWLSKPFEPEAVRIAREAGAVVPTEETINREVLVKRGVPEGSVRVYGPGVMSTYQEALELGKAARTAGKTVLVVTSRWHARRARWVFRAALPEASVLVCATPYERFTRRWWSDQAMAYAAVTETAKTVYYLLGGRFVSKLDETPHRS